jgi:hypothetical protein
MRRDFAVAVFLLMMSIGLPSVPLFAQDTNGQKASPQPAGTPPLRAYRLDFSLSEMDGGKKIDTRQYSIDVTNMGQHGRASAGTRVPVGTKTDGTPQYMEVETTINANLYERNGLTGVDVSCDVSSVAADQNAPSQRPILRTLSISGGTIIAEGKPTIIGQADDPNSKHQFQLEMTATELK